MGSQGEVNKTPLNAWHHAHGGKMVDFAGWDMPVQYEKGIITEHLATRRFAGLFDVSHMGRFKFHGKNRIKFMQHVLTNNCLALEPWQAQYTIIASESGGAIDDSFLYRFGEDDYLLVVNASNLKKDWDHFQKELAGFKDVELEDCSQSMALIAFQGPVTKHVLSKLVTAGEFPEAQQNCLSRVTMCGTEVVFSRTGYTGEPNSFELFLPADKAEEVWTAIWDAGKDLGVEPVGLGARDTLRLEASMPLYGHELGLDPDGQEIPVFAIALAPVAVSFSPLKGEFIGRQALLNQFEELKLQRAGVFEPKKYLPKRIKPLAVEDKGIVRQGNEVFLGERMVGRVTSGTSVPYLELAGEGATMSITDQQKVRSLALAYLDAELLPDTELTVQVRKRSLRSKVVANHGRSDAPPYFHALPVGWEAPERKPAQGQGLAKMEHLVKKSLENHRWRQKQCVNLIPSEMTPTSVSRLLSVTDPSCRYGEHRELEAVFGQDVFYYQGTDFIAWVEDRLAAELAEYLGTDLVEVRPISGQMANMTVFSAMVSWRNRANLKQEPGRIARAMTHHIRKGGHLSAQPMGALRDYIRKDPVTERFAVVNFPVLAENPFQVDLAETRKIIDEQDDLELIVFGRSMTLHKEPVAQVAEMVKDKPVKPLLMYDMAHVLGLLGPHFQEPFKEGADIVTGSTHKTFFGTQRGVVGCNFEENTPQWELWEAINRRAFPGMTSNHHLGSLLGLLAAAIEMNTFKAEYQPQVVANAVAFAEALHDQGLNVCGDPAIGYTQTHQVVLDVGYAYGASIARKLEDNNIIVNYQGIPSDEGFTASSGLRLGVSEMTRFGMKEQDFTELAGLMAEMIKKGANVGSEVVKFRERFLDLKYCFSDQALGDLKEQLLAEF